MLRLTPLADAISLESGFPTREGAAPIHEKDLSMVTYHHIGRFDISVKVHRGRERMKAHHILD